MQRSALQLPRSDTAEGRCNLLLSRPDSVAVGDCRIGDAHSGLTVAHGYEQPLGLVLYVLLHCDVVVLERVELSRHGAHERVHRDIDMQVVTNNS